MSAPDASLIPRMSIQKSSEHSSHGGATPTAFINKIQMEYPLLISNGIISSRETGFR